MPKPLSPFLGIAVVLAATLVACNRIPPAPPNEAAAPAPGPRAYDVVKMDRFGGRKGPIYFAHALHADLPGLDGEILSCSYCHLEVCGPPRRCGECHIRVRRRRGEPRPKMPST